MRIAFILLWMAAGLAGCRLAEPVPPVAEAGDTLAVRAGEPLRLDASSSFDPDGAELMRYVWRISGTPEDREARQGDVLADGSEAIVEVPAPFDQRDVGRWELELEVTDETGRRATDTIFLEVLPLPQS